MPNAVDWKKRASEYRKLARAADSTLARKKYIKLAEIHRLWASREKLRARATPPG